ncbi:carboxymuconolactone decarboxylase family protein [Nocardia altamirensis]|uniref:carboxymuconolactone decarboxylase family protein n=1 Tax=Nocardia TaxID=1817 RepID=UPI0008400888|nr:carboxymuconolactone decarboxylase family protein [Nocardia altamirensis]
MSTPNATARLTLAPAEEIRPLVGLPADKPNDPNGPLAHLVGAPVPNVLAAIGNHPGLLTALNPFLTALGTGLLALRDRELAVLRIGYLLRSDYEWAHHVAIGTKAGLTADEIARVPAGPDAPGWSASDAALLRAVDELRGPAARVSDSTWQQLAADYDAPRLVELLALIGTYTMLAYVLNSCDVPIEDWFANPPALPEA